MQIVNAHKAAVNAMETGDVRPALTSIANAFLAAMRPKSIPLRLNMQRVPMNTRIFVGTAEYVGAELTEGQAIRVISGAFDVKPRRASFEASALLRTKLWTRSRQ